MLNDRVILVTGGTGTFGQFFIKYILRNYRPQKVIIYSRDEFKQLEMAEALKEHAARLRFFIGDVRDKERLNRALENRVDYVIHAAAMKQISACEYNPLEAIKNNIHGSQNVIDSTLDQNVAKVIALSTDKAVNPISLYGATKMVSDRLFIAANSYVGKQRKTCFSVVRYGNVFGSRGSVLPLYRKLLSEGISELPITDPAMTRFWISLKEAVQLVLKALETSRGGETYIARIPSIKITDLAEAMSPGVPTRIIGIRPGEKLHEVMITRDDAPYTYQYDQYFVIYPAFPHEQNPPPEDPGVKVPADFSYTSENNTQWLGIPEIQNRLREY